MASASASCISPLRSPEHTAVMIACYQKANEIESVMKKALVDDIQAAIERRKKR